MTLFQKIFNLYIMRSLTKLLIRHFFLLGFSALLFSQDCETCFKQGDCRMDLHRGYKIYSQSKGVPITIRDTIELNVVFYGQKEYIFTFCTGKELYPIHFRIFDPDSGSLIYDNKEDRYIESLGVGFDVTKNLKFKINVLGETNDAGGQLYYSGCLGMLFQYKSYDK